MATTVALTDGRARTLCTGAPDVIILRCTHSLGVDGKVRRTPIGSPDRHFFCVLHTQPLVLALTIEQSVAPIDAAAALSASRRMAADGLRVLALSSRDSLASSDPAELQDLTLVCLLGIKDKLRGDVPLAVRKCQTAGVTVRMLTGDSRLTAENIAKECGILGKHAADTCVMEGSEFRAQSDAQVGARLHELRVLARCSPTDKHRLVRLLREAGEVVAVTGDGTNDAPQLNEVRSLIRGSFLLLHLWWPFLL